MVPKPSKKSFETWKTFVEWIKEQEIVKTVDFESKIENRHEATKDGTHLKERKNETVTHCKKDEIKYGQQLCKQT